MTRPILGVCYYPEHWPQAQWASDARAMRDAGLTQVRIGEFAWSRLEPNPGQFAWKWLDQALGVLGDAGLRVMLCTPTATPPKWLIDAYPDILAWDIDGRPRGFGSRRHYCFSSSTYQQETIRIVTALAERYGNHPAVAAWQTDNEYGCHQTTRSYSPAAANAFRRWLQERYGDVDALNRAWGTVFWSQEYRNFGEIDLPQLMVTEANPSHRLDFYRFSSDQVIAYNRLQADILRRHSPHRDIVHNVMGFYFEFDHFALGRDLDLVGWDSYPLGFLDVIDGFSADDKQRYMRQGHPDIAAFHHDLYRACGRGRWSVIEQQPGPVNWAHHNPAPLPGMVRLWTHEAIAHGAESVQYFRWRQAPFAQEQMHAGLRRCDDKPAAGHAEVVQTAEDLHSLDIPSTKDARVALVFSYDASWLFEALPQGRGFNYPQICFEWYGALRALGLDVDIVSPDAPFGAYAAIFVPSLPIIDEAWVARIAASPAMAVFGPRSGSKSPSLQVTEGLPPGPLRAILPFTVTHVESLPSAHVLEVSEPAALSAGRWIDHVETDLDVICRSRDGIPLALLHDRFVALLTCFDGESLTHIFAGLLKSVGIDWTILPQDVRVRRRGALQYLFNYGTDAVDLRGDPQFAHLSPLLGTLHLPPAGVFIGRDADIADASTRTSIAPGARNT